MVVGDAGAMRNGDGQASGDVGIGDADKTIEALGEVVIGVDGSFVEGAGAGTAETRSGIAGWRTTEIVLALLIPGESKIGFGAVGIFHAGPPDLD